MYIVQYSVHCTINCTVCNTVYSVHNSISKQWLLRPRLCLQYFLLFTKYVASSHWINSFIFYKLYFKRESLREEKENQEKDEKPVHPFSLLHAKLDQGLLGIRPQLQVNQQQLFPPGFSVDSPLQRMASITNSLVSQPLPSPNFGQRPLKAVLPPITQQQVNTQVLYRYFMYLPVGVIINSPFYHPVCT